MLKRNLLNPSGQSFLIKTNFWLREEMYFHHMTRRLEKNYGVGALGTPGTKNSGGGLFHLLWSVMEWGLFVHPKSTSFAIKLDQKGTNSGSDGLRWETSSNSMLTSDVPTPLFYRGNFYILSDLRKNLSAVNTKSAKQFGQLHFQENINGEVHLLQVMVKSTQ